MSYNSHHTGKNTELKKDDKATVDISQSLRSHHMLYCVEKKPQHHWTSNNPSNTNLTKHLIQSHTI